MKKRCCKGKGRKNCLPVHNELDRSKPIFLFHLYLIFAILSQLPGDIFVIVLGTWLLSFPFFLLTLFLFLFVLNFLLPHFVAYSFLDSLNSFLLKWEGFGSCSSGPYNQWNFSPVLKILPQTSRVLLIDTLRLRHCNWPFTCYSNGNLE